MFAVLALRAHRAGLRDDHGGLGQIVWGIAYRWISLTNGDNGVSINMRPHPFGLGARQRARRSIGRRWRCSWWRSACMAVFVPRRSALPARHPRPAAAHDRARLQCVADAVFAFLFSGFWSGVAGIAVSSTTTSSSARRPWRSSASAEALLMVIAGGTGTLARPDRRRGAGGDHEERRQRLYRALELCARRDLRADRRVHAGGVGAWLGATVALGVARAGTRRDIGDRAGARP